MQNFNNPLCIQILPIGRETHVFHAKQSPSISKHGKEIFIYLPCWVCGILLLILTQNLRRYGLKIPQDMYLHEKENWTDFY